MIRSMTGFGRGFYTNSEREYTVEIKAVNHRYTDINVRLPYGLSFLEDKIKKKIQEKIERGKIDISITFVNNSNLGKKITINQSLAKAYIEELKKIEKENNITNDITVMKIARLPDVLNITQDDNSDILWEELSNALEEAIANLLEAKEAEGKKLAEDMKEMQITVSIKTGEGGKTFGSVSTKEIAQAAKEQLHLELDKKKMQLDEAIKTIGTHMVPIKLHPQVTASLKVIVEGK